MSNLKVRKRDGEIVDFDAQKILIAISKAYKEKGYAFFGTPKENEYEAWIDMNLVSCDRAEGDDVLDIEYIQNEVQKEITRKDYEVGLAFILYREHARQDRVLVEEQMKFVENYMKASNTANATIDDNSNVGNKNIGVLNAEIHKGRNLLSNRGWIQKKLKQLFPSEGLNKQYITDLKSRVFYKNDENSFPFPVPYTYSAKETVVVKLNGKKLCLSLDSLYAMIDTEESVLSVEDNAHAKYPKDLFVKDKEGWTKIERLVRKERRRDLVRVKTAFGEDVVVTDNHPMIVNDNIDDNVQAIDSLGQKQLRVSQNVEFGERKELDLSTVLDYVECYDSFLLFQDKERSQYNAINRHLKLDRDFGYVVGFFIGDGHYNNANGGMLSFTQKERETLENLADKLWKSCGVVTTITYKNDKSKCWNARVHSNALVSLFRIVFKIKDYAQNKNLPIDIFEYSKEFALGVLEGIIDSDGTVESNSQVSIRLSSRECICQLAVLVKELGFGAAMFMQNTPFSNNSVIHQNYTIWGVRFSNTKDCVKLTGSYKWRNQVTKEVGDTLKYKDGWSTITGVSKIENGSFLLQNKYIYDITTKTHSFVANNLLVHNCTSSSMYPFYLHGLFTLGGKSSRPKNLDSYCGMFCNLVFAMSGMFAGACMHKDQSVIIRDKGSVKKITSKALFETYAKYIKTFENYQGTWEYSDTEGLEIFEDGKFVALNRVYRRKYDGQIYEIRSSYGGLANVSADHKFKHLYDNRLFETKAKDLKIGDTVALCNGESISAPSTYDVIDSIIVKDNDDDFVYEVETESHWYNCGGFLTHNCAFPEALVYFDFYARKEWGDDYYLHPEAVITTPIVKRQMTIEHQCRQYFEQMIHTINQPSGARGQQSAFVNFSIFDKAFFDGMFGNFYFDAETLEQPKWESVQWLQELFMKWLNAERLRTMLTFPVVSVALLNKDGKWDDERMVDFVCKEWSEGDSFFVYISDSIDSLSSCCFRGDTKVLWKSSTTGVKLTTFEELYGIKTNDKKNFRVFHNGSWVSGRTIKLAKRDMYKVVTENNKEFVMTDNHINVTLNGEKQTQDLVVGDYLLFNTQPLNAIAENDEHLTYAEGFVVGMFLGDGSFGTRTSYGIYDTNFSLNEEKYPLAKEMIEKALSDLNLEANVSLNDVYNNVYPCRVSSKELVAFIQKWTLWTEGTKAFNKKINLNALVQSIEFRRGILDGWYHTDGGNSNRCYTTSKELVDCMEAIVTSLGLQSRIDVSDRTSEVVEIRGEQFNRNYPLYTFRWYEHSNNRANKDMAKSWVKFNNGLYFKIKSIEKLEAEDAYCIECTNQEEPYFTLPSGLITHNCRLKNKIQTKEFNFTNGNMGVETGSKSVISLNLSRIMQNFFREVIGDKDVVAKDRIATIKEHWEQFSDYLNAILERIYKYHIAYNETLWDFYNAGLLPVYSAGFIDLNKQYLTIGINGLNQSAEFCGIRCNDNDDYAWFCEHMFGTIKAANTAHNGMYNGHKLTFNTECVPAESLAVKNYNWDKEDGYWVPEDTNLYASYIFKPYDKEVDLFEKIVLHGKRYIGDFLDGGSAAHLNLDSHLSKIQYRHLLDFAAREGCQYLTFNVPNSECQECGFIAKQHFDVCPRCGSTNVCDYDRIIGYLTKIANWSDGRKAEQKTRVYENWRLECLAELTPAEQEVALKWEEKLIKNNL